MAGQNQYQCVKNVYSVYRTALMNRKYYGYRLASVKRWNFWLEIGILVGTSTTVGSWAIWKAPPGVNVWGAVAGLATLAVIIKPVLNLSSSVERYTKLFVGHGDGYYDLKKMVADLARTQVYSNDTDKIFKSVLDRLQALASEDDPKPDQKLCRRCFEEVKREVAVDSLWWPT